MILFSLFSLLRCMMNKIAKLMLCMTSVLRHMLNELSYLSSTAKQRTRVSARHRYTQFAFSTDPSQT